MNHYILLDNASGYVWGECFADNPELACRLVDEGLGESGREYAEVGHLEVNETGYRVFEAPTRRPFVRDGQHLQAIEEVCDLPLVAIIQVVSWDDFE